MRVPTTELQVFSHRRSNQTITATAGHPFWVVEGDDLLARGRVLELPSAASHLSRGRGEDSTGGGGRWTEARHLRLGDQFLTRTGKSAAVVGLTIRLERLTVYNLHVLDAHTYAVADCGVLVHNACLNPLARARLRHNQARDTLAKYFKSLGWRVDIEKAVWTPFGRRVLDIVIRQGDIMWGIEVKTGRRFRIPGIQRLKDDYIRRFRPGLMRPGRGFEKLPLRGVNPIQWKMV